MEVILIEDVDNLGRIGELVKVANGYGRNFLLPRKMAIAASTKNQAQLEHQKRIVNFRVARVRADAESVARRLGSVVVTISRKVGEQDKLFGSVTVHDIQEALTKQGVTVDRKKITLAEPIKSLGTYSVPVRLSGDVTAQIKVTVAAEAAAT